MDFDFLKYVDNKKAPESSREEKTGFGEYAFSGDIRVLRQLDRAKPVRLVAESTVRFWKTFEKNDLLGSGVRVSRRQFPSLYEKVLECADMLDIRPPTVYVSENPHLNAGTYGTDEESFILITSSLIDRFDDASLKFVIGHECGHIQNNHVVYRTAADFLRRGVVTAVRWAVVPATMALNAWSRRGEITCDRAGMICAESEEAALNAMLRLAVGSKKLFDELDIDEYLNQLDDVQNGVGRVKEYMQTHPYLPKRVQAIRLFADSAYYRNRIGERGGRQLDEIDREVEELVKVL
ncbi:MAG: M48 family metallopeptidase [Persicimonas sp.]